MCQWLPADPIDEQVLTWFFESLSVAEVDLAAKALAEMDEQYDHLMSARHQEVERLRYQAHLAGRQYQHTDPENRLVASELEARWEVALRELKEAEEKREHEESNIPCWAIPEDLLESLKEFGARFPEIWDAGILRWSQKKSLLRCLVDKVVVHRSESDQVHTRVVWRGGATTSCDVPVRVGSFARLSTAREMEEAIVQMSREGQTDEQIAQSLTSQGYRSP